MNHNIRKPKTKQIFLSDWIKKLTKEFDDIRKIDVFDRSFYYIWVNAWKPVIINEKWDTLFSWLEEIESNAIHIWDVAISGIKKLKTFQIHLNN